MAMIGSRTMRMATCALAIAAMPAMGFAAAQTSPATGTAGQDAQPDKQLAADLFLAMNREFASQPATATVEDLEAALMFVIQQSDYTLDTINLALDKLAAAHPRDKVLLQAIENVRRALARGVKRGTAALGSGVGFGSGGGFGAPVVAIGGGGSNYGQ